MKTTKELREINYGKVRQIVKQQKANARFFQKMFVEADNKTDPMFKELQELRRRVEVLERTNKNLRERNEVLENVVDELRSIAANRITL